VALKAIIDSVDGLDESVSKLYVQDEGGKFRLDVEAVGGGELRDTQALHSALSAERKARREAVGYLKTYGDYDEKAFSFEPKVDAGEYDTLKAKMAKLKDAKPDERAKAEWEARMAQLEEKHGGELASKDKELAQVNGQITKLLITSKATEAIAKHAPDAVDLLMPHVQSATSIERNGGGDYIVRVSGPDGGPIVTRKAGQTGDMDIDEYVETVLRERFPKAYPGSGATGSGATGGDGGGGSGVKVDPNMSPIEKLKQYHEQRQAGK
jgi:hypothetical protein